VEKEETVIGSLVLIIAFINYFVNTGKQAHPTVDGPKTLKIVLNKETFFLFFLRKSHRRRQSETRGSVTSGFDRRRYLCQTCNQGCAKLPWHPNAGPGRGASFS
jgi:hypothetical protein